MNRVQVCFSNPMAIFVLDDRSCHCCWMRVTVTSPLIVYVTSRRQHLTLDVSVKALQNVDASHSSGRGTTIERIGVVVNYRDPSRKEGNGRFFTKQTCRRKSESREGLKCGKTCPNNTSKRKCYRHSSHLETQTNICTAASHKTLNMCSVKIIHYAGLTSGSPHKAYILYMKTSICQTQIHRLELFSDVNS